MMEYEEEGQVSCGNCFLRKYQENIEELEE
jgi:hypothetical protein